jgi:DNA-binding protein HU-beta
MSKKKIIDAVSAKYPELTKADIGMVIDTTFNTIAGELDSPKKKFGYPGFGTWDVRTRAAREGVNPQNPTGPKIKIGPSATVGFRPSTTLKSTVN